MGERPPFDGDFAPAGRQAASAACRRGLRWWQRYWIAMRFGSITFCSILGR